MRNLQKAIMTATTTRIDLQCYVPFGPEKAITLLAVCFDIREKNRVRITWSRLGGPPHPVIVTIRDNRDILGSSYIRNIPLLQGGGSS